MTAAVQLGHYRSNWKMGKLVRQTFREVDLLISWTIHSIKVMTAYKELVNIVTGSALNDYSSLSVQKTNV